MYTNETEKSYIWRRIAKRRHWWASRNYSATKTRQIQKGQNRWTVRDDGGTSRGSLGLKPYAVHILIEEGVTTNWGKLDYPDWDGSAVRMEPGCGVGAGSGIYITLKRLGCFSIFLTTNWAKLYCEKKARMTQGASHEKTEKFAKLGKHVDESSDNGSRARAHRDTGCTLHREHCQRLHGKLPQITQGGG